MATDNKSIQNTVAWKPPLAHFQGTYLHQVFPLYPQCQALCTEAPLKYHTLKFQGNLINAITVGTNYQLNLELITSVLDGGKRIQLEFHCTKKKGEIYSIFPHVAFWSLVCSHSWLVKNVRMFNTLWTRIYN